MEVYVQWTMGFWCLFGVCLCICRRKSLYLFCPVLWCSPFLYLFLRGAPQSYAPWKASSVTSLYPAFWCMNGQIFVLSWSTVSRTLSSVCWTRHFWYIFWYSLPLTRIHYVGRSHSICYQQVLSTRYFTSTNFPGW